MTTEISNVQTLGDTRQPRKFPTSNMEFIQNYFVISKAKIGVSLIQTTTEIYVAYPKWLWKSTTCFSRQCSLIIYWFHKYDNKWLKSGNIFLLHGHQYFKMVNKISDNKAN